jgi:hypothetical protein
VKRTASLVGLGTAILLSSLYLHFSFTQQRLQRLADGLATLAAHAAAAGEAIEPLMRQRYGRLARENIAHPLVEWPPRSGRFAGDRQAVRVTLKRRWRPPLLAVVFSWSLPIEVRATAMVVQLAPGRQRSVARVE